MKVSLSFLLLSLAVLFGSKIIAQNQEDGQPDYGIKKGRYYSTLTFSLDARKAENEDQLLRQVINQDRFNYRIRGNGGYAIKDNFTLGLSLGYGRQKQEITFLDEDDQEITSKRLQQGISIAPNMRQYIPIGSGKLQILVQTELGFTFGESLERIFRNDDIDKINVDFFEFNFGVSPGVALFFNQNWAFETTVSVAGLTTRIEEEVLNDDDANKQRIEETSIDLQLNLLALNLGVAYYF